jgi:glycolate oxidase
MTAIALSDPVLDELRSILGEEGVLTSRSARYNRTRVPAPFPVHRWSEIVPDLVVLPTTAEQVSAVVRLANRYGIPVVPRAGGTGLNDGAVPLKRGIVLDVKRMNQIKEIDLVDRTVTVGPGINMLKLNEVLRKHGVMYPDDPASYPCSLVGGRIGTSGWSLLGSRYGHTRDLVISFQIVLPTGDIIEVGDGGGRKVRKSSTGFQLKHLLMGHQGTLGIVTEATLELVPRPEVEFAAFFAYPDFESAYQSVGALTKSGLATLAGVVLFDEYKLRYLRRDDEAYIPQPDSVKAVVATAMYGSEDETVPAARRLYRIARETGGRYLGDEVSQGDWASRHDRYATPLHGRLRNGQVAPMSWHCEDASINYSKLPQVMQEWHAIADRLIERHGVFDDWGMFFYTNGAYKPWGDYLVEIDIGIWEQRLNDENWAAWVQAKKDIADVSLKYGGSITACHGATRAGEVDLVPVEMGGGFDLMLTIKRALDPNNIMNPGKYLLDQAYVDTPQGGAPGPGGDGAEGGLG